MSVIIRNCQGRNSKCSAALKYRTVFFTSSPTFLHVATAYDRPKLQSRDQQPRMDGQNLEDPKSTADMTVFVQNLLQQMQSRFQAMSDSIVTKIDEMGNSISELEQSINELRAEMGAEGSPSPMAPSKSKPDEVRPEDS